MIPCPYCGKPNQLPDMQHVNLWFRCPHCNQKWQFLGNGAGTIQQAKSAQSKAKKPSVFTIGCWTVVALLSLLFAAALFSPQSDNKDREVFDLAKNAVRERLKSPSTASFSWLSDSTVREQGNGRYFVAGYVDSENSFGAKIRSKFRCNIRETENKWIIESVVIDSP